MSELSVVIPTLNCANEMPAHLKSMESWLDLADEMIVVDSHSDDCTSEIIREGLRHPVLRVLNHPRGLYQSWNHAISQTAGKWIYISTVGDTITREQLEHLLVAGEALNADVVVSPPEFVFCSHVKIEPPVWPVHRIVDFHDIREPAVIDPLAAFVHALMSNPDAILGSSASNIYRGDHLRARPFPTCFRMAGDTGWAIRNALETRFCYTNRVGSVFRFHSDTYKCPDQEPSIQLFAALHEEGMKILRENKTPKNSAILEMLEAHLGAERKYMEARAAWRLAKNACRIPWYLRPSALKIREQKNILRRQALAARILLDDLLRKLRLVTSN